MNFTIGGGSGTCSETSLSIVNDVVSGKFTEILRPSLFLSSYPHRQHLEQLQIINMKNNTNVKDELPSPDFQKDMSGIMRVTLDGGSKSKSCLPWYCAYYEWSVIRFEQYLYYLSNNLRCALQCYNQSCIVISASRINLTYLHMLSLLC